MRALSFLKRKPRARIYPHAKATVVPVNVKPPKGHRSVIDNEPAPLEYGLSGCDLENVRKHLPSAPSPNLQAARHAHVLDQERAFLTDDSGKVPPPDKDDLIRALRYAAEFMRDRIVIGSKA